MSPVGISRFSAESGHFHCTFFRSFLFVILFLSVFSLSLFFSLFFHFPPSRHHRHRSVFYTGGNDTILGKQLRHFPGMRRRTDIPVIGSLSREAVPHSSSGHIGLKACGFQPRQDISYIFRYLPLFHFPLFHIFTPQTASFRTYILTLPRPG